MLFLLALGSVPIYGREAGDAPIISALMEGLLRREAAIQDVRGVLLHETHRSQTAVDEFQEQIEGGGIRLNEPHYSLFVVGFVAAQAQRKYEIIAVKGGLNEWGLPPTVGGPSRHQENVYSEGEYSRFMQLEDGQRKFVFRNFFGTVSVSPQTEFPPVVSQYPLCKMLMLAPTTQPWSSQLQKAWEEVDPTPGKQFHYEGKEKVAGVECHKLTVIEDHPVQETRSEFWIAEEYGYAVVQFRSRSQPQDPGRAAGMGQFLQGTDFREVGMAPAPRSPWWPPGLPRVGEGRKKVEFWLPHRYIEQHFVYRPGEPESWRTTHRVTFVELNANTGTTPADFEFHPALGTALDDPQQLAPEWGPAQDLRKTINRLQTPPPPPDIDPELGNPER